MSSMFSATRAKISLTSMPLLPYFWNLNGEGNAAPVFRSVARLAVGRSLPAYFSSAGLGSNVSTWDGPPLAKIWITRLAFAGKCGCLGASGLMKPSLARAGPAKPSDLLRQFQRAAPGPNPYVRKRERDRLGRIRRRPADGIQLPYCSTLG